MTPWITASEIAGVFSDIFELFYFIAFIVISITWFCNDNKKVLPRKAADLAKVYGLWDVIMNLFHWPISERKTYFEKHRWCY